MRTAPSQPEFSFVIPLFNEEGSLPALHQSLASLLDDLGEETEIIFVDDGSTDGSLTVLLGLHQKDPRVKIVQLSRNFGQQIALCAGIDHARGRAVISMDADLQHPPATVRRLIEKWKEGNEVVYGIREGREIDPWWKKTSASLFYLLFRFLTRQKAPSHVSDFRLLDRKVVAAFRSLKKKRPYLRGIFSGLGFRQAGVPYHAEKRFAGETKYSLKKMLRLAIDGILCFPERPLRILIGTSLGLFGLCLFGILFTLFIGRGDGGPALFSVMVVGACLIGLQSLVTGSLAFYISRKDRGENQPLYTLQQTFGFQFDPVLLRVVEKVSR